jgi:hypothetical protein
MTCIECNQKLPSGKVVRIAHLLQRTGTPIKLHFRCARSALRDHTKYVSTTHVTKALLHTDTFATRYGKGLLTKMRRDHLVRKNNRSANNNAVQRAAWTTHKTHISINMLATVNIKVRAHTAWDNNVCEQ